MRHLEEGEIHAWLDGAVDSDEAVRIEAHIARCPPCAADVATARGLIAGASRILLALDGVPAGVIPATKPAGRRQSPWFSRPLTRIAAAMALAVGIGAVATRDWNTTSNQLTVTFEADAPASSSSLDSGSAAPVPTAANDLAGVASSRADAAAKTPVPGPRSSVPERGTGKTVGTPAAGAAPAAPVGPRQAVVRGQPLPAVAVSSGEGGRARSAVDVSAEVRRAEQRLLLSEIVTTGTAAGGGARLAVADVAARAAALGGACLALDVNPTAGDSAIPLLPGRMRIRLAESPTAARELNLARSPVSSANLQGAGLEARRAAAPPAAPAAAASSAFGASAAEPAEPLPWQPIVADSVVARLVTPTEVVVFRLQIIGDQVTGIAGAQSSSAHTATISGRRVTCGGGL